MNLRYSSDLRGELFEPEGEVELEFISVHLFMDSID